MLYIAKGGSEQARVRDRHRASPGSTTIKRKARSQCGQSGHRRKGRLLNATRVYRTIAVGRQRGHHRSRQKPPTMSAASPPPRDRPGRDHRMRARPERPPGVIADFALWDADSGHSRRRSRRDHSNTITATESTYISAWRRPEGVSRQRPLAGSGPDPGSALSERRRGARAASNSRIWTALRARGHGPGRLHLRRDRSYRGSPARVRVAAGRCITTESIVMRASSGTVSRSPTNIARGRLTAPAHCEAPAHVYGRIPQISLPRTDPASRARLPPRETLGAAMFGCLSVGALVVDRLVLHDCGRRAGAVLSGCCSARSFAQTDLAAGLGRCRAASCVARLAVLPTPSFSSSGSANRTSSRATDKEGHCQPVVKTAGPHNPSFLPACHQTGRRHRERSAVRSASYGRRTDPRPAGAPTLHARAASHALSSRHGQVPQVAWGLAAGSGPGRRPLVWSP